MSFVLIYRGLVLLYAVDTGVSTVKLKQVVAHRGDVDAMEYHGCFVLNGGSPGLARVFDVAWWVFR